MVSIDPPPMYSHSEIISVVPKYSNDFATIGVILLENHICDAMFTLSRACLLCNYMIVILETTGLLVMSELT